MRSNQNKLLKEIGLYCCVESSLKFCEITNKKGTFWKWLSCTGYSDLQLQWNSYLSISSMIPNVLFLFINAFLGHKFRHSIDIRTVGSYLFFIHFLLSIAVNKLVELLFWFFQNTTLCIWLFWAKKRPKTEISWENKSLEN